MSAEKNEVDKIGGTKFYISLPYERIAEMPEIRIADIMGPLIETAKGFIIEQTGAPEASFNLQCLSRTRKLYLKHVAAFINIKGIVKGKFVMSMDQKLIGNIVRNFVLGELTEEEKAECFEDTLAECANIIFGNSIKMFPNIEEMIAIEAPITMYSNYASLKYSEEGVWTCDIECDAGCVGLSFVSSEIVS